MNVCSDAIQRIFSWHTRVATTDVGPDRLLTPSAQLRYQQEAGELHFGEGGLGFDAIASLGMAFLVLQNNCVIYRRPASGEAITVKTWSHSVKGIKFYRCYRFEDAAGNLLIDSMAVFALVDVKAHTLLRPSAFPYDVPHVADEPHTCPVPPRLKMPDEATPCGEHEVTYSQLDFNAHLNNTRYADIAFDRLPHDTAANMKGFSITFAHEAKCGDCLTLTTAETDDSRLICAKNGEETCFILRAQMK